MTITINEDVVLPTKFKVCYDCLGRGHYPPGAYTSEEFEEAFPFPEDKEDYMNGFYDLPCPTCKGKRVVEAVDRSLCTPEDLKLWDQHLKDEADYQALVASELAMGA